MGALIIVICLYVVSFLSHINYTSGINSHSPSHINKPHMIRCKSAPDLRLLYNDTIYTSINDNNKNLVPYNKYKSIIFNRYRRNIYLRSKEKYTLP